MFIAGGAGIRSLFSSFRGLSATANVTETDDMDY